MAVEDASLIMINLRGWFSSNKIDPSMKDRFEYIFPKEKESEPPDSV